VIGCAVPDQDERAVRTCGAQAAQHVDGVNAVGACIGPDPHLTFIVEIQAIERDFGRQTRGCGDDMKALAPLAPAIAEIDILMDVCLVEIDEQVLIPLRAV
jgi:hypothetical protein